MQIHGCRWLDNTYAGYPPDRVENTMSTFDPMVCSSIDQVDDVVTIQDVDHRPSLEVGVDYLDNGASLYVRNSGVHPTRHLEHVVKVSFPLPGMSQEDAKNLQGEDLLNGASEVSKVSVKTRDEGGYRVEIGDGAVHNSFSIKDQGYLAR